MSYVSIAGASCTCPKCGNKPSFEFPSCQSHIRWHNQYGAKFTIFCEDCKHFTDVLSLSGEITQSESKSIERPMYNWKSDEWKVERRKKLVEQKAIFAISYPVGIHPSAQEIQDKLDKEIGVIDRHLGVTNE